MMKILALVCLAFGVYGWDPEQGEFFEGDMIVDPDEVEVGPYNAMRDRRFRWPNGVMPYEFSPEIENDPVIRQLVLDGITALNERTKVNGQTCLSIQPRNGEIDYVRVERNSGCFATLGRRGGEQIVNIGPGCERHGTIVHEFLHGLGFYHEQSRNDRDNYVTIVWDNILPGYEGNFRKMDLTQIDHLDVAYDYGSCMHYPAVAFPIDPNYPTIVPHDPNAEIGQREQMSPSDILKVQRYYECGN